MRHQDSALHGQKLFGRFLFIDATLLTLEKRPVHQQQASLDLKTIVRLNLTCVRGESKKMIPKPCDRRKTSSLCMSEGPDIRAFQEVEMHSHFFFELSGETG